MYNVGIIGFGKMGILHGALLNGTGRANLVAICDKSLVMRWGFKRVYPSVKVFENIEKMLEQSNLDLVIVATPTFNHMESALKCIDKGCHVFIEKPLAINYEQAETIRQTAEKKGVKVQVGYCNRFCPSITKGKQIIEAQGIGHIISAKACMYIADVFEAYSGWRYCKETSGGGVLMDFGIHMLDEICWYFGKIDSVQATSKRIYSKEVEDELNAVINFKNGIKVIFDTSWSKENYRKSYSKLEINGDRGKLIVTDQTLVRYDLEENIIEEYTYPQLYPGAFMDIGGLNYSYQIATLIELMDSQCKTTNIQDAVYDQFIVEKLYESSEKNILITC